GNDETAEPGLPHADGGRESITITLPADTELGARWLMLRRGADEETPPDHDDGHDDGDDAARWRRADLRLGVPYIAADAANGQQFIPQWLSLERLDAFNLKKGCDPGQEIVARMHYLGQSKRAAYRLRGNGTPPPSGAQV